VARDGPTASSEIRRSLFGRLRVLTIQVVPRSGTDAYRLLRDKVTHEARTWAWANRAKTRLPHNQIKLGYIEVSGAEGVLVAHVHPHEDSDLLAAEQQGKPAGILIGFASEDDWFEYRLENDPGFLERIARARLSIALGKGAEI
jgi:hypothetical protein